MFIKLTDYLTDNIFFLEVRLIEKFWDSSNEEHQLTTIQTTKEILTVYGSPERIHDRILDIEEPMVQP